VLRNPLHILDIVKCLAIKARQFAGMVRSRPNFAGKIAFRDPVHSMIICGSSMVTSDLADRILVRGVGRKRTLVGYLRRPDKVERGGTAWGSFRLDVVYDETDHDKQSYN
jgi:hypothetical protein